MTIKFTKKDFVLILSNYSIGHYLSHNRSEKALENTIFFIKTTKGKYVLKIFENTKPASIKKQTFIQNYLAEKNNPVPIIIKSNKGKEIFYYNKKPIQIQEFVLEYIENNSVKNKLFYIIIPGGETNKETNKNQLKIRCTLCQEKLKASNLTTKRLNTQELTTMLSSYFEGFIENGEEYQSLITILQKQGEKK